MHGKLDAGGGVSRPSYSKCLGVKEIFRSVEGRRAKYQTKILKNPRFFFDNNPKCTFGFFEHCSHVYVERTKTFKKKCAICFQLREMDVIFFCMFQCAAPEESFCYFWELPKRGGFGVVSTPSQHSVGGVWDQDPHRPQYRRASHSSSGTGLNRGTLLAGGNGLSKLSNWTRRELPPPCNVAGSV